jgi:hypothetical protein
MLFAPPAKQAASRPPASNAGGGPGPPGAPAAGGDGAFGRAPADGNGSDDSSQVGGGGPGGGDDDPRSDGAAAAPGGAPSAGDDPGAPGGVLDPFGPDLSAFCAPARGGGLGLRGDTGPYYLVDNSLVDCVLARRRGLPMTLALLQMAVGRAAGLDVQASGRGPLEGGRGAPEAA